MVTKASLWQQVHETSAQGSAWALLQQPSPHTRRFMLHLSRRVVQSPTCSTHQGFCLQQSMLTGGILPVAGEPIIFWRHAAADLLHKQRPNEKPLYLGT